MNKEELIKKWLDNNLNSEEQSAFEQLDDYKELIQIDSSLKNLRAPEFLADANYSKLKPSFKADSSNNNWLKPLLRVAAVLAIAFSVYFYTTNLDTELNTKIAEQTEIELPDQSTVKLNANSYLAFNAKKWTKKREVKLIGEAFFKVAKGQKFDVITDDGIVMVLGTQFNVKQRDNYFEVTCYEGLVGVSHNNATVKLHPGDTYKIIDGKLIANEKESTTKPSWVIGESSFKSLPLKYVIAEFENQYNHKVTIENVDTSRLFTGSFTHKNLELALKSITIPLNLEYKKTGNSINIKRE